MLGVYPFLPLVSSHPFFTIFLSSLYAETIPGSIADRRGFTSIERNKDALDNVPLIRRWSRGTNDQNDDFPYRGHGQPITAYLSLGSCLFILVIANAAGLWKEFHVQPFLSAYLAVCLTFLTCHYLITVALTNFCDSLFVSSAFGSR